MGRKKSSTYYIIDVTSGVRILLNIYTLVAEVQELYRFNTSVKLNADQMDTNWDKEKCCGRKREIFRKSHEYMT